MLKLHRVAREFYGRPLLITPDAAHTVSNFLLTRMGGPGEFEAGRGTGGGEHDAGESREFFAGRVREDGSYEAHTPRASRFYGEYPLAEDGTRRPLPFRRTAEGVAIITAVGEWVNRGGWVGASSGLISYEGFKYQLEMAKADPRTRAVLIDLESPGGQAVGAFEAADAVRAAAAVKPVWALVNGMAASAAYAIASGATRIVTTPTGISGSIGVVLMHLDFSAYLKEEGIKPTLIFAGDRKVDGNPYEPLPPAVRDDLKAEVDAFYDLFVGTVAKGRAGLTDKAIRATQARTFMGEAAVAAGLADAVGTFESTLAQLSTAPVGRSQPSRSQGASMSDSQTVPGATAGPAAFTQADLDAARATGHAAGLAEGRADADARVATAREEASAAERTRIGAILGHDAVKGHEGFALKMATKHPSASADDVAEMCDGRAKSSSLEQRMDSRRGLDLDAEAGRNGRTAATIDAAGIYASRRPSGR